MPWCSWLFGQPYVYLMNYQNNAIFTVHCQFSSPFRWTLQSLFLFRCIWQTPSWMECTMCLHEIMCHLCQHWISISGIKSTVFNEICKLSDTTTMVMNTLRFFFVGLFSFLSKLPFQGQFTCFASWFNTSCSAIVCFLSLLSVIFQ